MSNPTSRSEARPQDLADGTEGRALVASGSPFPPMRVGAARIPVARCNNVYVFPGVGLAVTAIGATRVTDAMMTAAAGAVAAGASIHRDPRGALLPERAHLADTATTVAEAVARSAVADGVAPAHSNAEITDAEISDAEISDAEIRDAIRRTRWEPVYPT